jgi:hypothetical protein
MKELTIDTTRNIRFVCTDCMKTQDDGILLGEKCVNKNGHKIKSMELKKFLTLRKNKMKNFGLSFGSK